MVFPVKTIDEEVVLQKKEDWRVVQDPHLNRESGFRGWGVGLGGLGLRIEGVGCRVAESGSRNWNDGVGGKGWLFERPGRG